VGEADLYEKENDKQTKNNQAQEPPDEPNVLGLFQLKIQYEHSSSAALRPALKPETETKPGRGLHICFVSASATKLNTKMTRTKPQRRQHSRGQLAHLTKTIRITTRQQFKNQTSKTTSSRAAMTVGTNLNHVAGGCATTTKTHIQLTTHQQGPRRISIQQ